MTRKGYILVEGQGELKSAPNLISRLCREFDCGIVWSKTLRWKNLHVWDPPRRKKRQTANGGIRAGAEYVRSQEDAGALLILRDEDDGCPKSLAPEMAGKLRALNLPFPVAYVLLHREYEVLFLPCLESMTGTFPDGRKGLVPGTEWDGEERRSGNERRVRERRSGVDRRHKSKPAD